jgi:membrane-associated protein
MEFFAGFFDLLLHLDQHLTHFVSLYGAWVYALLMAIIFAETGLVIAPWLPGDSLLFVVGTLAGAGSIDYATITPLLMLASFGGDSTNYAIGRFVGERLFTEHGRLLKREHLERTREFYRVHGGKTVVIARFLPIIRTFAPFVAGIGQMGYPRFALFSATGSLLWVGALISGGFFLGNLPWVKQNLTLMILLVIALSLLPGVIGYLRHRAATPASGEIGSLDG